MSSIAAAFLLPFGVVVYTIFGGIRATFLTDYIHTCVIIIIVLFSAFRVYATSDLLGSPGRVYVLVREAAQRNPVTGNYKGEYMTIESRFAGILLVINLVDNFGTVFLDNGYWNKAISASPAATLPAYVMGGLACMPIPFLTSYQVNQGLVLPAATVTVMGKGGASATLLMIFLAIRSGVAAEIISVASVFTYDVYRDHINPMANSKQLIYSSHAACFVFGIVMNGFSVGLTYGSVSMGYIY